MNWPTYVDPDNGEVLQMHDDCLVTPSGNKYLVDNNIARFVESDSYSTGFGVQWIKYLKTQLDSFTGYPISEDRLKLAVGELIWENLSDGLVLEAGCGAGRFTEVLLNRSANVMSVDLSKAVEANQQNFPQSEQHRIIQADITRLPFQREQFDIALCLGVVQHTPVPEETIRSLYNQVRKGGYLVFDHYHYSWYVYTCIGAVIARQILKRLDAGLSLKITEKLANLLLPIHKRFSGSRLPRVILERISPIKSYYGRFPIEVPDSILFSWSVLDTHDGLTDWYKHTRNKSEIREFLSELGAIDIHCEYGMNGVVARCRKS